MELDVRVSFILLTSLVVGVRASPSGVEGMLTSMHVSLAGVDAGALPTSCTLEIKGRY